jgi:hypothetical protein
LGPVRNMLRAVTVSGRMSREVTSRADELSFGFADGAIDEGIYRTEDAVTENRLREGQLWLSTIFELIRRGKADVLWRT